MPNFIPMECMVFPKAFIPDGKRCKSGTKSPFFDRSLAIQQSLNQFVGTTAHTIETEILISSTQQSRIIHKFCVLKNNRFIDFTMICIPRIVCKGSTGDCARDLHPKAGNRPTSSIILGFPFVSYIHGDCCARAAPRKAARSDNWCLIRYRLI